MGDLEVDVRILEKGDRMVCSEIKEIGEDV